jgi:hypothetical protein
MATRPKVGQGCNASLTPIDRSRGQTGNDGDSGGGGDEDDDDGDEGGDD